jgi:hypothetical protein
MVKGAGGVVASVLVAAVKTMHQVRYLQVRRPMLCHVFQTIPRETKEERKGPRLWAPLPPTPPQCHISSDARLPLLDPRAVPLECRAAAAVSALLRSLFDQLETQATHQH